MCKVCLNTVDKVKSFVNINSKCEMDIFIQSGRYVIDAKSIMGIFSLDLTKPLELTVEKVKGSTDKDVKKYLESIAEFIVE